MNMLGCGHALTSLCHALRHAHVADLTIHMTQGSLHSACCAQCLQTGVKPALLWLTSIPSQAVHTVLHHAHENIATGLASAHNPSKPGVAHGQQAGFWL
jgi:hypothetical protein